MPEVLFEFSDLKIFKRNNRFFARYDAGAHFVQLRKDEITERETRFAIQGENQAQKMLLGLQKRLIDAGVYPYVSNVKT